jgi:prepilin-type N-terminal cleavage/methylation domain-containing protein
MRARHRRSAGVSLTELLIVVAMIGILAAVAVPTFAPDAASHLESAGSALAGDLAYTRSLAVANGSKYRLSFNATTNKYALTHSGTNPALNPLPSGPIGTPSDAATQKTADLSQLPMVGSRVRLLAVQRGSQSFTQSSVEFGPLGATTTAAQTTIWLTAGSGAAQRYIAVKVNPVTGLATRDTPTAAAPSL